MTDIINEYKELFALKLEIEQQLSKVSEHSRFIHYQYFRHLG